MECGPTAKLEVERAVTPAVRTTGVPRLVAPSRNCTVPVGLFPVTVAVNVTNCPNDAGLLEVTNAVVVDPELLAANPNTSTLRQPVTTMLWLTGSKARPVDPPQILPLPVPKPPNWLR